MILYKNTFKNVRTINCDFPVEDQYYANNNLAVVADGITRDPIGVLDLSELSFDQMLKKYPRPSGAELAAKAIVDCFRNFSGDLKQQLIEANKSVKKLNKEYIKACDYLQNDYFGAAASCAFVENNKLHWSYICDCGVIVYDKSGNIKFQTPDDKELISDPYINKIGVPWNLPEARVVVRRDFRNNVNNIQDGICVSYGAITGEPSVDDFIKSGSINIDEHDTVIVYSDGFINYLYDLEFVMLILNFDIKKFESYIEQKASSNYDKYGKEKTLVILKK